MARFPFFRDITGKKAVIVGGGEVALRRARMLSDFGAEVLVVSPCFIEGFAREDMCLIQRPFEMADLDGADIVVTATDDHLLNAEMGRVCRERGIEVNVADDPSACSFQFPALIRRGKLTVGLNADGAGPVALKYLRGQIESALPDRIEEILVCMEKARAFAGEQIHDRRTRARALKDIFEYCVSAEELPDERALEEMICRCTCAEMD